SFIVNDKMVVEFRINIISSESDLSKFVSPNEMVNITLIIGENRVKVSKEYLAVHSPVFTAMFFGKIAEKRKDEIEIKDVIYEEFLDLLNLIYLGTMQITDRTVLHILKLADQFQMQRVVEQSEKHLTQSKGFDTATKLIISDQYRLFALKEHCFSSFAGIADLMEKLNRTHGCAKLSDEMKLAIFNRF
ncbi:hypothetical protein PENTCL1PPCAC_11000, partial [Pristionchus entomophagus]